MRREVGLRIKRYRKCTFIFDFRRHKINPLLDCNAFIDSFVEKGKGKRFLDLATLIKFFSIQVSSFHLSPPERYSIYHTTHPVNTNLFHGKLLTGFLYGGRLKSTGYGRAQS